MRKLGIGSENVQKKREPYWKALVMNSLGALSIVLALLLCFFVLGSCAKPSPMTVLAGEAVYQPTDLKCWMSGPTFICNTPKGLHSVEDFLIVGKLRYAMDAAIIKECIDRGLAVEESLK